jgi:AcrR family transcriptional regulator
MSAGRGSASPVRVSRVGAKGAKGARRGGLSASRAQVSEMQRSRLLGATVAVVDELGYARTSVAHITSRARVSRRTFYGLFDNREACFTELLEDVVAMIEGEIARASLDGLPWRERVRGGLWTILCFFDREPALARVCVVQALRGSPRVLRRREEILARLAVVLDEGRAESARAGETAALTSEGLVGAAFSIVYARLLRGERDPLSGLLGELMGMIVLPYLGTAAARREQTRALPLMPVGSDARGGVPVVEHDPLQGIPMRLTYRTARVLECIAQQPGASNRMVAEHAGVTDQGQISKLLARLERLGLIANAGEGHAKGEPNAWMLTQTGLRVAHSIRAHTHQETAR